MKSLYTLPFFVLIVSCNTQSQLFKSVNTDEFEKGVNTPGVQVLDVRTSGEFNSGHIKNALWADWTNPTQFNERIKYVDKTKPVYVYCLSGARSTAAAEWMTENGFSNVVELEGGLNAWKRNDKPLEGSAFEKQISLQEYNSMIPADQITLVDFGATWCPPCIKMEPILKDLSEEKDPNFKLVRIDAGAQTDILKQMNIDALPVFIVYKNGKETWRKQGVVEKAELEAQLK